MCWKQPMRRGVCLNPCRRSWGILRRQGESSVHFPSALLFSFLSSLVGEVLLEQSANSGPGFFSLRTEELMTLELTSVAGGVSWRSVLIGVIVGVFLDSLGPSLSAFCCLFGTRKGFLATKKFGTMDHGGRLSAGCKRFLVPWGNALTGSPDLSWTCRQTLWWDSQSLCWQKRPQYLASLQPLHVSLANLPQFQQFCGDFQN